MEIHLHKTFFWPTGYLNLRKKKRGFLNEYLPVLLGSCFTCKFYTFFRSYGSIPSYFQLSIFHVIKKIFWDLRYVYLKMKGNFPDSMYNRNLRVTTTLEYRINVQQILFKFWVLAHLHTYFVLHNSTENNVVQNLFFNAYLLPTPLFGLHIYSVP